MRDSRRSWFPWLGPALALGVAICGLALGASHPAPGVTPAAAVQAAAPGQFANRAATPATAATKVFPPGVGDVPPGVEAAFRLVIPRLGIDAAVEPVGTDRSGRIGVPSYIWDAGWFREGPVPGDPGDAVMDGHLDWYTGPALFAHLDELRPGDAVTVVRGGATLRFRVVGREWVPYRERPAGLLEPAGPPRLTLITCGGSWNYRAGTYSERLLVEAALD